MYLTDVSSDVCWKMALLSDLSIVQDGSFDVTMRLSLGKHVQQCGLRAAWVREKEKDASKWFAEWLTFPAPLAPRMATSSPF